MPATDVPWTSLADAPHARLQEGVSGGWCRLKASFANSQHFSRLTPSASINSHGSMNENSFATQTTQTGDYWVHKGDSFDSASCYTNDSRLSLTNQNTQNKGSRSRSVPSIRCVYCKRSHGFTGMRTSESMHYTPRVVAIPGEKLIRFNHNSGC